MKNLYEKPFLVSCELYFWVDVYKCAMSVYIIICRPLTSLRYMSVLGRFASVVALSVKNLLHRC